jgi:O-antigen ligase
VIWLFIANPQAALRQGRGVALLTFLQLWILVWLGGELLWKRKYHRQVIWMYVIACLVSAFVALQEGGAIGDTFDTGGGEGGLGGINSSARQFSVAIVLLVYLRSGLKPHHWLNPATWLGTIILLIGVAQTGSRTGILIVAASVVLMLLSPTSGIKPQRVIVPSIVIFAIYFAVPDSYWDSLWNSIFPTIQSGTDTVATRYELWATAMRMLVANPFTGVGINQFAANVAQYSDPLSSTVVITGAHSVYFSVLAETGIIGFVCFMGMVVTSILHALRAALRLQDKRDVNLAYSWFVILVLLLIGGLTKQDQHDKLLWFTFGACTSMSHFLLRASIPATQSVIPGLRRFLGT